MQTIEKWREVKAKAKGLTRVAVVFGEPFPIGAVSTNEQANFLKRRGVASDCSV